MKILLSSYACEAGRGSEPGVGWNTVWEIAKYHEVWVLTRPDDGREAIESALARNPNPNLHFVYFTLPLIGSIWKLGSIAFVLHYYLWQIQAYFVAKKLYREVNFDLIHHVTFVRYSTPSFISFLPPPFVWGTVGGGECAPTSFWKDFDNRAKLYEILRLLAHRIGELDPFTRLTAKYSAVTLVTTKETEQRVRLLGAKSIEIVPEASLSPEEIAQLGALSLPGESKIIRFISIGRLLHWKGFYLAVQAFSKANIDQAEYWIVGTGNDEARLKDLACSLDIEDKIKFFGQLPRHSTLEKLGQCHVLVHPSLHDSGGWVCLEGMAAGRPILCLDHGGPGVQVTQETGIKIPANTPEQVIQDLSTGMEKLAREPDLRIKLGKAGRKLVEENYNWESKGLQVIQRYQDLIR